MCRPLGKAKGKRASAQTEAEPRRLPYDRAIAVTSLYPVDNLVLLLRKNICLFPPRVQQR